VILNVSKCPACGGTSFAVEVKTWVQVERAEDSSDEYPRFGDAEFDDEDADYAEPIPDGEIICRQCLTRFRNNESAEVLP
jgi:hypothetical protein